MDGGEISEIEERLVEDFQEAIGEEGLTPEQEEAALAELTSFFENVSQAADHVTDADKVIAPAKEVPKGEFKTAELEGFSEAETFSLINPETEISPKLPEQVTPKNEDLFGKEKPQYSIEEEAKKSREWFQTRGLYLPKVETAIRGYRNKILFDYDLVKPEYSTADQPGPVAMPSLTDVQTAFKGQGVTQLDDGSFAVKTRGGQDLIIRSVDRIDADSYALNIGYGQSALSRGKVVAGKYHQGTIELTRGAADNVTLAHESIHFMEDIGVLNSLDVAALRGHIKRLVREGKFETQNKEDIGGAEDRATFIAAALTSPPKGAIGRIISRIQDFIDKIVNAFGIRTVGGVIRDIKTGEVFGSKVDNQSEWTYSYIHEESANNISDGRRETLRDNSGRRAGVQYRPTVVGREKIGGLKVSGRIIHKPQDAAQIAAQYLKKYPDEHLISLVMDKEGKLLHVYRHTVGLPGSSMASAPIIAGEALNTPGAANIIVAHNHPSQRAELSAEDRAFTKSLEDTLRGSGVELTDSLAVTTDKYSSYAETEGTSPASLSEETTGKINIPLLGRVFEVIHNGPKVNNAESAKSHAEALIPDGGVLVMDGQNAIAGTVDISDFSKIRGRVQAELLKAFEKRNGRAMIVYSPNRAIKSAEANNLAKFLGAGQNEVKLLDIIDTAGSWADKGTMPQSSWGNVEFYSYQIPSAEQGRQESMIVDWERKGEGRSQGNPNPTSPASASPGSRQGTFQDKDTTSNGKVKPEKYSIRRQQDPPVSRDPKVLNTYLKDETDAIVQTIMNKLRPKHMTYLELFLKSPEWFDNPQISNIVRLFVRDRNERYHETINDLIAVDDIDSPEKTVPEAGKALKGKGLSLVDRLAGKESAEYKMLSDFIDYFDTEAKRNPNKSDAENLADCEAYMRKNGATDDVVRVWRLYRQAYDKALELQTRQLREMIAQIIEEAAFRGESPDASLAELKDTLKYALAEMETWKGYYAPRIREAGNWKVQSYKKHGPLEVNREYYRDHRGSELSARRLANRLRREGWTVYSVSQVEKLPESIYQDVKAAAAAKLIDNALDKVKENSTSIVAIRSEVLRAVADEIRARGFRSHQIRRKEGAVIKGYIEDPIKRHLLYANQLAGGLSKAYVARRAIEELLGQKVNGKHVGGIDPIADPKAYEVATNYIEEQLRNLDASDRIIGLAKSIATFKFLGFNIRSLAVNMTAIVTTAPSSIHQYAMGGKGSIAKVLKELGRAGGDYGAFMAGRKLANADEQAFLEDSQRKGWDDAQYTRNALGVMEKTHSRIWNTMMDGSMYLFGKSEQWNRGTTMLAAYRLARKRGLDYAAAAEAAKEASDRAHGVYGRATLPMWAQGTNPAAKVGQMLYIYSKFSHNYLQMLYDLSFKKKNIKGAMFAFLSPIVVAGGAALPFKDTIFAFSGFILRALFGEDKDPEKWVWDTIREHLGDGAEKVGRHGLTGAAGIDISGSLSIGVGIPRDMLELTGAVGGVIDAVGEGGKAAMRRQYSKAVENLLPTGLANPIRAAREAKEGVSTRANNPVWDERGRQLVPTSGETTARALGFRSARRAVLSERTWEGKRQAAHYTDLRQSIYQRYRAWLLGDRHNQEEHKRIMKMVREYNGKARELKDGEVPEIKAGSLRSQARRMEKAPKAVRANLAN